MDTAELFLDEHGEPRLRRCAVLFLDLLGVRHMATSSEAGEHLGALARALRGSYRDFLGPASQWPAAVFSDSLVLSAPILAQTEEPAAVFGLIYQAALLQMSLVEQGLFVRGGLALGDFHIHDNLIFGKALVDAYELESKHALHPRVILDTAAHASQAGTSDPGSVLLCDEDGHTFIDYLGVIFDRADPVDPPLLAHRERLVARLAGHRADRRRWEKYRWVAEYHNHVVTTRIANGGAREDLLVARESMTWSFSQYT